MASEDAGASGPTWGGATGNPNNINQSIEAESHYVGYSFGGASRCSTRSRCPAHALRRCLPEIQGPGQRHETRPANSVNIKIEREDEAWNYFLGLGLGADPGPQHRPDLHVQHGAQLQVRNERQLPRAGGLRQHRAESDRTREREDLPGYALGVSYYLIPGTLRVEPNFTYYLEKQATFQGARFRGVRPGQQLRRRPRARVHPEPAVALQHRVHAHRDQRHEVAGRRPSLRNWTRTRSAWGWCGARSSG